MILFHQVIQDGFQEFLWLIRNGKLGPAGAASHIISLPIIIAVAGIRMQTDLEAALALRNSCLHVGFDVDRTARQGVQ